jgi:hypothetical protein
MFDPFRLLEKMLIKHADGHHNSPDFAATGTT